MVLFSKSTEMTFLAYLLPKPNYKPSLVIWLYTVNFCIPLKFLCWKLTNNVMVLKGGNYPPGESIIMSWWKDPHSGINALINKSLESSPLLSLCPGKHTAKRQHLWVRKPLFPCTKYASALILEFLSSRIVRNNFLLFTSCSVYCNWM
jgi:hypothetical protein